MSGHTHRCADCGHRYECDGEIIRDYDGSGHYCRVSYRLWEEGLPERCPECAEKREQALTSEDAEVTA